MTTWQEVIVQSCDEFRDAIHGAIASAKTPHQLVAWRGMGRVEWPLQTTLDRFIEAHHPTLDYAGRLAIERALLEQFKERSRHYCVGLESMYLASNDPASIWGVMALARHHGLPTRALDWTGSPWVAAFFSCFEHSDADGTLWWFDQTALETILEANWDEWKVPRRPGQAERALEATAFEPHGPTWATKIHHQLPFRRMEAQQGFMMICSRLGNSHEDAINALPDADTILRGRIRIPASLKGEIMHDLRSRQVHAEKLEYPILDVIAKEVQASSSRQA
jgi:hypothetical protein